VLAACSGGGSTAATTTTSTTASHTTTSATSTTLSQEEEVKAAYLAYWQMIDRLSAAPDPNDPELAQRVAEPFLSFLRDDFATRAQQGRTVRFPHTVASSHNVRDIQVASGTATITDCFIDDRVAIDRSGSVIDDEIVTKVMHATMSGDPWLVTNVRTTSQTPGVVGCGA